MPTGFGVYSRALSEFVASQFSNAVSEYRVISGFTDGETAAERNARLSALPRGAAVTGRTARSSGKNANAASLSISLQCSSYCPFS